VRRHRADDDRREVLLALTQKGERVLRNLFLHHRAELRMRGPELVAALKRATQIGKDTSKAAIKTSSTVRRKN